MPSQSKKKSPAKKVPAKKTAVKKKAPSQKAVGKRMVDKKRPAKTPAVKVDVNKTADVEAYMARLDSPFKAEVQALRDIIKGVNKEITEEIKWNAPTFSYKGYIVTFNLHSPESVRLVFHNGIILDPSTGLLQGDYPDRRLAYFTSMADVKAKQPVLEKLVRQWVTIKDQE